MKEKYIPSAAEIERAESMMTPQQREMSEKRARFKFQERDAFDDFMVHISQSGERREATDQEKARMDKNFAKLWEVLGDSEITWSVDGALNISVLQGDYIGIHKDVDISIGMDEIDTLDGVLLKGGYGLFLSTRHEVGGEMKTIMERVDSDRFRAADVDKRLIAAIDKDGKIQEEETLNFLDIHVIEKNEGGNIVGSAGVELPEEWFVPRPLEFRGTMVNTSHPAKVAYYKLHDTRNYDRTDLNKLAEIGALGVDDVDTIGRLIEEEIANREQKADGVLDDVVQRLDPKMDAEQIFASVMQHPIFVQAVERNEDATRQIREFCKQLSALDELTLPNVKMAASDVFSMDDMHNTLRANVEELRGWVEQK